MRIEYDPKGWKVTPTVTDKRALTRAMEALEPLCRVAEAPGHTTAAMASAAIVEVLDELWPPGAPKE